MNIRNRTRCFLLLFLLVSCSYHFAHAAFSGETYIYGFSESSTARRLLEYLRSKSDCRVNIYDLNDTERFKEFFELIRTLEIKGVQVIPTGECTSCLLNYLSWSDIYLMYAQPLLFFFQNGRLTSITIGVTDYKILDEAFEEKDEENGLRVFTTYEVFILSDDARISLEKRFSAKEETNVNLYNLLPSVILAAIADAVNPCEFYVLVVFLSLVIFSLGRKAVLKAGIAFSLAVFITYFSMGFGLLQLIGRVREARILVTILGFTVGLRAVLNFIFGIFGVSLGLRDAFEGILNKKFKRVPNFFSKRISKFLRMTSEGSSMAFVIGVVTSVFLLPCTSGPYLIALSLISNLNTLLEGILLLLIYNSIIIVPFITMTVGIYTLRIRTSKLKRWSRKKQRWFNLIAGLIMIILSLYLMMLL